jgi:hypothetical protein
LLAFGRKVPKQWFGKLPTIVGYRHESGHLGFAGMLCCDEVSFTNSSHSLQALGDNRKMDLAAIGVILAHLIMCLIGAGKNKVECANKGNVINVYLTTVIPFTASASSLSIHPKPFSMMCLDARMQCWQEADSHHLVLL